MPPDTTTSTPVKQTNALILNRSGRGPTEYNGDGTAAPIEVQAVAMVTAAKSAQGRHLTVPPDTIVDVRATMSTRLKWTAPKAFPA